MDAIDRKDKESGTYRYYEHAVGFDVDMCKAIAAAIFGTSDKHVIFLNVITGDDPRETNPERFTALSNGIVDILVRNSTVTLLRELDFEAGPFITFDGAKIMLKIEDRTILDTLKTFTQTVNYIESNNIT